MLRVIVQVQDEVPSNGFWSMWLDMSKSFSLKDFAIRTAVLVRRHIINKYNWTSSTGSHYMPTPWHYHHHLFSSLWYQVIFFSYVHRMLFQICKGFRCCSAPLPILFLSLTNGLHRVVKPLYSLCWSLLLIVDTNTQIPPSWNVFFIWRVFLHQGKNTSFIHLAMEQLNSRLVPKSERYTLL